MAEMLPGPQKMKNLTGYHHLQGNQVTFDQFLSYIMVWEGHHYSIGSPRRYMILISNVWSFGSMDAVSLLVSYMIFVLSHIVDMMVC